MISGLFSGNCLIVHLSFQLYCMYINIHEKPSLFAKQICYPIRYDFFGLHCVSVVAPFIDIPMLNVIYLTISKVKLQLMF